MKFLGTKVDPNRRIEYKLLFPISIICPKGSFVIEPKGKDNGGANVLRWLNAAGNPIFRKRVQHPGFRGYHLIRDGSQRYEDDLRRRIESESENLAQVERLR